MHYATRMKEEIKKIIDDMSYEEMLCLLRNASSEHPMFQGDTGDHFLIVLIKKREKCGDSVKEIRKLRTGLFSSGGREMFSDECK